MIVFSKQKFIEVEGQAVYEKCKSWVDAIDGKRVVDKQIDGYLVSYQWEVDIPVKESDER